jgi:hypothetical protein
VTAAASTVLEDELQFLFNWQSSSDLLSLDQKIGENVEFLDFKTNNNENYKCAIPIITFEAISKQSTDKTESNIGQTLSLLADFHQKKLCSYRVKIFNFLVFSFILN